MLESCLIQLWSPVETWLVCLTLFLDVLCIGGYIQLLHPGHLGGPGRPVPQYPGGVLRPEARDHGHVGRVLHRQPGHSWVGLDYAGSG